VPSIPLAWKSFWMHQMQLLCDVGHVDIPRWEIVLILTQDRCIDRAEHTIGLEK
jgi:hypothetical protein